MAATQSHPKNANSLPKLNHIALRDGMFGNAKGVVLVFIYFHLSDGLTPVMKYRLTNNIKP